MKLILSRKGFDHESGEEASPILEDGKLVSLPIPAAGINNKQSYEGLYYGPQEMTIADLMESLSINRYRKGRAHLDPDLRESTLRDRDVEWRPIFGQDLASASHLNNNKVSEGDVFLFFGWFRKTKNQGDKIVFDYLNDRSGKHLIFGYLQIGQILRPGDILERWMEYHPHAYFIRDTTIKNNIMYVATPYLSFMPELRGGGNFLFNKSSASLLTLTRIGSSRISEWYLDKEIFGEARITYHLDREKSWKYDSAGIYFQSAKTHWQEAVITDNTGKVEEWVKVLFSRLHQLQCIEETRAWR